MQLSLWLRTSHNTMTENIVRFLNQLSPLDKEDMDEFLDKLKPLILEKGDIFVKTGKICSQIGFIVKGCMVCVYNKDGVDIIDEFSFENEFITDYPSFLRKMPAEKDIRCLEDTRLLTLLYEDLQALYDRKKSFERIGRLMAEAMFLNWHQKSVSFVLDDAETRYRKLIENRPNLMQRVPQYFVASYLGITPESLSRIRKNISC